MELKYVPPPDIISREYIRRLWNCWVVSGDDDKHPGNDKKITWTHLTHPRDRRRQFLKDTIFYVCPKDINLNLLHKCKIKSLYNPSVGDHDFTIEIGDYVVSLLNHTQTQKVLEGSDNLVENVFTEKTLRTRVRKQLQLMDIDSLEYFMFFLVYICKTCSNLITKAQLDLMSVVMEEAEKHMTCHSDKFQGYEELHRYATQKMVDGVETSNRHFKEFFIEPFR